MMKDYIDNKTYFAYPNHKNEKVENIHDRMDIIDLVEYNVKVIEKVEFKYETTQNYLKNKIHLLDLKKCRTNKLIFNYSIPSIKGKIINIYV